VETACYEETWGLLVKVFIRNEVSAIARLAWILLVVGLLLAIRAWGAVLT
jgi:hypothetical protein